VDYKENNFSFDIGYICQKLISPPPLDSGNCRVRCVLSVPVASCLRVSPDASDGQSEERRARKKEPCILSFAMHGGEALKGSVKKSMAQGKNTTGLTGLPLKGMLPRTTYAACRSRCTHS